MPALPAIKTAVLREVAEQLRFAPRDVLTRDLARAEDLARELDPAGRYPEDWIVFRLTGYRGESPPGEPRVVPGAALLADVSAFVERMSAAAGLRAEDCQGAIDAATLAERWRVSRKTLDRMRREGLTARRVETGDRRRTRLVFMPVAVDRFERARRGRIDGAARYSRMDAALRERLVREAARYQRALGMSLSAAAERLAARHDRSHEAVRQVLLRAVENEHGALRGPDGVLGTTRRGALLRASRAGIPIADMCRKYRRSGAAVRRGINLARVERLLKHAVRGDLGAIEGPTFRLDDAATVLLAPRPVREGLGGEGLTDLHELVSWARRLGPPLAAEERPRLIATHYLRWAAARAIAQLDRAHPSAEALDRIETWLRWCARLKVELVRTQLRLVLETLDSRCGRPVEELPPGVALGAARGGIAAACAAPDTVDPFNRGRLAAAVGLAVDRFAVTFFREHPQPAGARRAAALVPRGVRIDDWTRSACAWQGWLDPPARVRAALDRGMPSADAARLLTLRFGFGGGPPTTRRDAARALGMTAIQAARAEQRAVRGAMQASRTPEPPRA